MNIYIGKSVFGQSDFGQGESDHSEQSRRAKARLEQAQSRRGANQRKIAILSSSRAKGPQSGQLEKALPNADRSSVVVESSSSSAAADNRRGRRQSQRGRAHPLGERPAAREHDSGGDPQREREAHVSTRPEAARLYEKQISQTSTTSQGGDNWPRAGGERRRNAAARTSRTSCVEEASIRGRFEMAAHGQGGAGQASMDDGRRRNERDHIELGETRTLGAIRLRRQLARSTSTRGGGEERRPKRLVERLVPSWQRARLARLQPRRALPSGAQQVQPAARVGSQDARQHRSKLPHGRLLRQD